MENRAALINIRNLAGDTAPRTTIKGFGGRRTPKAQPRAGTTCPVCHMKKALATGECYC